MSRIRSFSQGIGRIAVGSLVIAMGLQPALAAPRRDAIVDSIVEEARRGGVAASHEVRPVEAAADAGAPAFAAGPQSMQGPPEAAAHASGKARTVTGSQRRVRRDETRPLPASDPRVSGSNSADPRASAPDWRELRFAGRSAPARFGLDPELRGALGRLRSEGRASGYAFLRMDEHLSPETRSELADLGIEVLGAHGSSYKVRLPLDEDIADAVAALPYVEWLGGVPAELKLDPDLDAQRSAAEIELPVVVNLFDDDPDGAFADALEAHGLTLGAHDAGLRSYRAVAPSEALDAIAALDFVLFVEPLREASPFHDQSMASIGVDYLRPGAPATGGFDASSVVLGIMDTGFDMGAGMHVDLNKNGCGADYTGEGVGGVWGDAQGHGTHVLGTITGTGTANPSLRGVATALGNLHRIRAAKVWRSVGGNSSAWMESAMDFFDDETACNSARPDVVNISGGATGLNQTGTDSLSRKLDEKIWNFGQLYVVAAGNSGPTGSSIGSPGVAKNALTVGNVYDFSESSFDVGDVYVSSSRGPTGDGRMKPNVVAPGHWVQSARAGTTNQYSVKSGTSMAAPHVTGLAATMMEHYPVFKGRPHLVRAHLMASAILHDDTTTPGSNTSNGRNIYGMGRVSGYMAHWAKFDSTGWHNGRVSGVVTDTSWMEFDIDVPAGSDRLVVVATWDEEPASAGAPAAVQWDLDLQIDEGADCVPSSKGYCGEFLSWSTVDNVEYLIIDNPKPGTTRLKVVPWNGRPGGLPVGLAWNINRGDTTPEITMNATASASTVGIDETFTVTTTVSNPEFVASGVTLEIANLPSGLSFQGVETTRADGTVASPDVGSLLYDFTKFDRLTLGNIVSGRSRSAKWTFRVTPGSYPGSRAIQFRARSENGGTTTASETVTVVECWSDSDCSDGLFCTGAEQCLSGSCFSSLPPDCSGGFCDETQNACVSDGDGDGVVDHADNCLDEPNPMQVDSDGDGYGNACDADYDQNGVVGASDFNALRAAFGTSSGDAAYRAEVDCNSDGLIGAPDFQCFKRLFGNPPGPSGLSCAGSVPCSAENACEHDVCQAGGALESSCADPCAATVCAADAYCCDVAWDSICVGEAATLCGACQ
jgi:hypothetical protein